MPGIAYALALTSAIFLLAVPPAFAQKSGGVLKFFHRDSPASGSIHEEATISAVAPFMGVFNNLVLFNQHEKQNRLELIEPELAESWTWNDDFTRAQLSSCGKASNGMTASRSPRTTSNAPGTCCSASRAKSFVSIRARLGTAISTRSPRMAITAVTFTLKRPQPAFLMLLAPACRRSTLATCRRAICALIRSAPAPSNSSSSSRTNTSRFAKNPDYWKPGRPYLDGIEWTIVPNRSTADARLYRRQVRHDLSL